MSLYLLIRGWRRSAVLHKLSPDHLASAQRSYDAWSRKQEYSFENYVDYVQRKWEKVELPPVPQAAAPQTSTPAYDPATYAPKAAPKTDPLDGRRDEVKIQRPPRRSGDRAPHRRIQGRPRASRPSWRQTRASVRKTVTGRAQSPPKREKNRLCAPAARTEPVSESCSGLSVFEKSPEGFAVHIRAPAGAVPVPADARRGNPAHGRARACAAAAPAPVALHAHVISPSRPLTAPLLPGHVGNMPNFKKNLTGDEFASIGDLALQNWQSILAAGMRVDLSTIRSWEKRNAGRLTESLRTFLGASRS